jgi:hypothetical protein
MSTVVHAPSTCSKKLGSMFVSSCHNTTRLNFLIIDWQNQHPPYTHYNILRKQYCVSRVASYLISSRLASLVNSIDTDCTGWHDDWRWMNLLLYQTDFPTTTTTPTMARRHRHNKSNDNANATAQRHVTARLWYSIMLDVPFRLARLGTFNATV